MRYRQKPWVQFVSMQLAWIFFFITCFPPYTLAMSMEKVRQQKQAHTSQAAVPSTTPVPALDTPQRVSAPLNEIVSDLKKEIAGLESLLGGRTLASIDEQTKSAVDSKKARIQSELATIIEKLNAQKAELEDKQVSSSILNRHNQFVSNLRSKVENFLTEVGQTNVGNAPTSSRGGGTSKNIVPLAKGRPRNPKTSSLTPATATGPHRFSHARAKGVELKFVSKQTVDALGSDTTDNLLRNSNLASQNRNDSGSTTVAPVAGSATYSPVPASAPITGPAIAADLTPTLESPITPALTALAASLGNNPVAIYEHLRNNFKYEPYYGIIKGAGRTMAEIAGNDADLAALTVSLLRAAGIPARIAVGTIEIPAEVATQWLGVEKPNAAAILLAKSGVPCEVVFEGGSIVAIRKSHVWAEAWLNPHPYLGAAEFEQGKRMWIAIDPSFKEIECGPRRDVAAAVGVDPSTLLANVKAQSTIDDTNSFATSLPEEMIIDAMMSWGEAVKKYMAANGLDSTNVYRTIAIKNRALGFLPITNKYSIKTMSRYSSAPPELFHRLVVTLADPAGDVPISYEAPLMNLLGKRLTLSFAPATPDDEMIVTDNATEAEFPAYLVRLVPRLRLEGQIVSESAESIGMGLDRALSVTLKAANGSSEVARHVVKAGSVNAIVLNAGGLNFELVQARRSLLQNARDNLAAGTPPQNDELLGETLNLIGLDYFLQADRLASLAASAFEVSTPLQPSELLVSHQLKTTELFDVPVTAQADSVGVEVKRDTRSPASIRCDRTAEIQFTSTAAMLCSAIERECLRQILQTQAVSAVGVVQTANFQEVPVHTLTQDNISTILPELVGIPTATIEGIQNAVNAGAVVTIPKTNITCDLWTGPSWIAFNPDTGESDYMIDNGFNGGLATIDCLTPGDLLSTDATISSLAMATPALDWLRVLDSAVERASASFIPAVASLDRWFGDARNLDKAAMIAACIAISGPIANISGEPAICNVVVSNSHISPNGDGVQDAFNITAEVTRNATWTVDFTNSADQIVHSVSGVGSPVSAEFTQSVPDGSYSCVITAESGGVSAIPYTANFKVDTSAPVAMIDEPVSDAAVTGSLAVRGSADDFNFKNYVVRIEAVTNGPNVIELINSTETIAGGVLAAVDTNTLENGDYKLILITKDLAGNTSEVTVPITINNPIPDTTAPNVTMSAINTDNGSAILDGAIVNSINGAISFNVTASDNDAVSKIQIFMDNVVIVENSNSETLMHTESTFFMTAGSHSMFAKAFDPAGNQTNTSTINFMLSPAIANFTVSPQIATATSPTITISATLATATNWMLSFTGPGSIPAISGSGTNVAASIDSSSYADGDYTVTLNVDGINNSPERGFSIDRVEFPPTAAIANISDNQVVREGLFDLVGTASDADPSDAVSYKVSLLKPDEQFLMDVTPKPVEADGWRAGTVVNASLGTLDFTTVRNGTYILQLEVKGGSQVSSVEVKFALNSQLKVGQFSFSQQDMIIPVGGQPLTVIRTYNSFNTAESGDFGPGWTWSIKDVEMKIDEERENWYDPETNKPVSVRTGGGRNVDITLPDGRRTTFTYDLRPGANFAYYAEWKAAPGVHASLAPTCSNKLITLYGGLIFWEAAGMETPMENFEFPGFILTMRDGTRYRIDKKPVYEYYAEDLDNGGITYVQTYGEGELKRIDQKTGDTIQFQENQIDHFNSEGTKTRSIVFQRDSQNRIIAIHDPKNLDESGTPIGPATITYEYDATGNLWKVNKLEDSATSKYLTTEFVYEEPSRPHFISKIKDPRGKTPMISEYDDNGRLVATVDAFGNRIELSHNVADRTETVFDRSGNPTVHGYDSRGNVVTTTDALNSTVTRTYDSDNNELTVTDALGNTTAYTYNSNGDRTSVTDPLGNTTTFTYDSEGNQLTSTDPLGNTTTNVYDGAGNLVSTTNSLGQTTTNSYDSNGNLTSTKDALGNVTATFGYDGSGNMTSTTDAAGFTRSFGYDANGNQTGTSFSWTDPAGILPDRTVATTTIYNDAGQVTKTIDPDGNESTTGYNEIGKPWQTTDKLGNTTTTTYDDRGNVIKTQYSDGTITQTVYDANGRTYVTQDRHVPGESANGTRNIYDSVGRVVRTERLSNVQIDIIGDGTILKSEYAGADSVISSSSSVYDKAGRVIKSTDATGAITRYEYSKNGRTTAVIDHLGNRTEYEYDEAGRQKLMRDALGREVTYEYDALGRRVRTNFTDGTFTSATYNTLGQKIKETDQAGLSTTFEYDDLGRLAKVIKPTVNDPETGSDATPTYVYDYDMYGRLSTITDPKGRSTRFTYDALGRQVSRELPMGQSESQAYNSLGQLHRKVDFMGQIQEFVYDNLGRVEYKKYYYPASTAADEQVQFVYDDLGRHKDIIEARGTTSFSYDGEGRLTQIQSPEGTINYDYDAVTGRKTRTWTVNSDVRYGYDTLGRLETVSVYKRDGVDLTEPEVTTYAYTAVGSRDSVTLPNGVSTEYKYDNLNRLSSVAHYNSADELLQGFAYTLAPNGRRTNVLEERREADNTYSTTEIGYTYDKLNRLVNEASVSSVSNLNYSNSYAYDLVGNRLSKVNVTGSVTETIGYSYNNNDQLTLESSDINGDTSYAYNDNGSLVSKTSPNAVNTYTYNLQNRLATADITRVEGVKDVHVASSYVYNLGGMRVRSNSTQTIDGITSTNNRIFLLDGGFTGYAQVMEELSEVGGTPTVSYTLGDDVLSQSSVLGIRHFAYDGHGSTRLLTDSAGAIANRYDYDAYGIQIENTPNVTNLASTNLLYSGEQFDSELQLSYNRARYYDASNGTWNRLDPFMGNNGDPQSLHKYAYCHSDPVNGIDPSGENLTETLAVAGICFNLAFLIMDAVALGKAIAERDTRKIQGYTLAVLIDALLLALPFSGPGQFFGRSFAMAGGASVKIGTTINLSQKIGIAQWGGMLASRILVAASSNKGQSSSSDSGGSSSDDGVLKEFGGKHGSVKHNNACENMLTQAKGKGATLLMKNKALRNAAGDIITQSVKPDASWTLDGIRHNINVVSTSVNGRYLKPELVRELEAFFKIQKNSPDAINHLIFIVD